MSLVSLAAVYRSLHSTVTALLDMTNHWHFNIDRGVVSRSVIFLDLKKDFDIVDHDLYDLGCRDGAVVGS